MFCPASIKDLRSYSKKFPGKFDGITINIHGSPGVLNTAIKDSGMEDFINTSDQDKAVCDRYKIMGVPTVVLIYPDGRLEYLSDIRRLNQLFGGTDNTTN